MAKTPLPMKPTGWFQVAWSAEIGAGEVVRMKYFGTEMIAWRSTSGQVTVMDAYCEHLGAHLGYGGTVDGEILRCPFHGWEWNMQGRNVCIPYEKQPNKGRRIRTYPVTEHSESVFIWHDVDRRAPYFDVTDALSGFDDGHSGADYYPAYGYSTLFETGLEIHPQYVMENGVDFAHFKYVHNTPLIPEFTRHDFDQPVSYVDFTIAFDDVPADEVNSGVQAINSGVGVAATKSWGMIDNRTLTAVTPIDESTSDVRFTVWIGRHPGDGCAEPPPRARKHAQGVIEQFQNDIHIWKHQRYSDPPALSRSEFEGFTALRKWANQFYPADVESKAATAVR
ncbi:Rieske 2Fe-2S domain-containing protein [Rhodococcus tibetensis]|uniref:Rieske-type oxygenase n=1 Tax=Rhodococcus tibetensis TaxID=2965064 RepID=A0ABT1QDV6_9NOCA|nr:Rieske 2Fe-2S domain-containing protein [Rhodococcus sp. FXJ9.536]MCQ4120473.1 Rieske (2Fe-2S) protein [Rhodococcus sp. FXJ9.536]